MTRLHAELMRSITHYRAQQQGNRPVRIFLCGGGAGMPYMREFFHEKFQVPIEFFNPLQNITIAESAPMQDVAGSAHLLGELVGLALRSVTVSPMELNLRPASVVRRQDLEKRRPFFIAADFESMEKLTIYREDAIHMKYVENVLKPNTSERLTLDYEMEPGKSVKYS